MKSYFLPESFEAQALLAAIITSSDDAIISKDLNGHITSWNPAAEKIFGYTAEEIVGKHISILIPAEKMSDEDYILGEVKAGRKVDHFETYRRRKDGSHVLLSVTVSPIKNSKGEIVGASKVARDISQVRDAERTSAYLGAIVASSDDAIISKDLKGYITSWNASAERIFGYKADEAIGKHVTLIIPADRLDEEDKILTTLRTGERVDHFETLRRHKNGQLIPISLTVSPIRDAKGTVIGASKVSRDISERIIAAHAVEESGRKKDEFLANMSHELRTPMNAVIGLTEILSRMNDLPEKAVKYVSTLKISAENMMSLINDLLDFAKIESNSLAIETVEFDLAEQIEAAISISNVKAKEKGISLYVTQLTPSSRYFLGDPLRVNQILMNLLSNALKFTEKGSVELSINDSEGHEPGQRLITIKVSDTGIGIQADKIGTIFDKFSQADSSITRRYGGSGLGLAITKACVEMMGGTISVESQFGLGTTFTVVLPLMQTGRISKVESFSAKTLPVLEKQEKNILLVEDYEPNVLVATSMIEMLGYNYDVAMNGLDAIRKFVHGQYDVILMDVQMHELDGMEATRRIRRLETEGGLVRTPIIAMTAHVREQDKEKCLEAGMDDFIPKPFQQAMLAQKIGRYIELNKEMTKLGKARQDKKK